MIGPGDVEVYPDIADSSRYINGGKDIPKVGDVIFNLGVFINGTEYRPFVTGKSNSSTGRKILVSPNLSSVEIFSDISSRADVIVCHMTNQS